MPTLGLAFQILKWQEIFTDISTCAFATSTRDHPVHLWDAVTGEVGLLLSCLLSPPYNRIKALSLPCVFILLFSAVICTSMSSWCNMLLLLCVKIPCAQICLVLLWVLISCLRSTRLVKVTDSLTWYVGHYIQVSEIELSPIQGTIIPYFSQMTSTLLVRMTSWLFYAKPIPPCWQLRCTYRAFDAMDEIAAAYSITFNPAGTK